MKKRKQRLLRRCPCATCQQHPHGKLAQEHQAINRVLVALDEKSRRRFAGLLALQIGRGGIERVHEISGLSRTTIRVGRNELGRVDRRTGIRRSGGGRIAIEKNSRVS